MRHTGFVSAIDRLPPWLMALMLMALMLLAGMVRAQHYLTLEIEGDDALSYLLWLPDDFDQNERYPVLLALPPGPQTPDMVEAGLGYWQAGPPRGWVVVSPVAPGGRLFFQGSETHIPALLDEVGKTVQAESVHLAGISNGGLSAFRIARLYPERFASLLTLPGFAASDEDFTGLTELVAMPIRMFVGEFDNPGWLDQARRTEARLRELGGDVELTVVAGQGHVIQTLSGDTLFDLLEGLP